MLSWTMFVADFTRAEILRAIPLSLVLTLAVVLLVLGRDRRLGGRHNLTRPLIEALSQHLPERPQPRDQARLVFDGPRLREASDTWRHLMAQLPTDMGDDWLRLRRLLSARFPTVPTLEELPERGAVQLVADTRSTPASLRIARRGHQIEVTITEPRPADLSDRYRALAAQRDLTLLSDRMDHLPLAAWTMDDDGKNRSGNAAHARIADRLHATPEAMAPLLRSREHSQDRPGFTYRAVLPPEGKQPEAWLDISARRADGLWDCAARDVSELVKAERAQRDFVQTLTKTFAQLSTGLAIFDRDRQLMLFNPALLDLTSLSPEFLASRPALSHFFDHLRDRQIMPEPKSYASWRDHLSAVVSAATDGRYHETWHLASGAIYQVTGRPHPNGAVAFLFEDITDQIATTRRLRQQLTLSQNVLDAFPEAIAIFDGEGRMSHCNAAYRGLFDLPEGLDLSGVTTRDALRRWTDHASTEELPPDLRRQLDRRGPDQGWVQRITLTDKGQYLCRVRTLAGGAHMVSFRHRQREEVTAPDLQTSTG